VLIRHGVDEDVDAALFTSCVFRPSPLDHAICAGVHGNELGDTDCNKFRVLARRIAKAGVLSAATGGQPERSDRYRHILAPLHYEHELRLALRRSRGGKASCEVHVFSVTGGWTPGDTRRSRIGRASRSGRSNHSRRPCPTSSEMVNTPIAARWA
jgi:hypothetical protein